MLFLYFENKECECDLGEGEMIIGKVVEDEVFVCEVWWEVGGE